MMGYGSCWLSLELQHQILAETIPTDTEYNWKIKGNLGKENVIG